MSEEILENPSILLHLKNITMQFGGVRALDSVNFQVN